VQGVIVGNHESFKAMNRLPCTAPAAAGDGVRRCADARRPGQMARPEHFSSKVRLMKM
jgi:hypothetical protein